MPSKDPAPVVPKKNIEIRDALPDTPPASKTEVAIKHVNIHRPFYVWLPLAILGSVIFSKGYEWMTNHKAIDDVPVGAVWNIVLIVAIAVLVNNIKPRSFDDIDTTDRTIPWWHICLDYLTTYLLYAGIWYAVTHG